MDAFEWIGASNGLKLQLRIGAAADTYNDANLIDDQSTMHFDIYCCYMEGNNGLVHSGPNPVKLIHCQL